MKVFTLCDIDESLGECNVDKALEAYDRESMIICEDAELIF